MKVLQPKYWQNLCENKMIGKVCSPHTAGCWLRSVKTLSDPQRSGSGWVIKFWCGHTKLNCSIYFAAFGKNQQTHAASCTIFYFYSASNLNNK